MSLTQMSVKIYVKKTIHRIQVLSKIISICTLQSFSTEHVILNVKPW